MSMRGGIGAQIVNFLIPFLPSEQLLHIIPSEDQCICLIMANTDMHRPWKKLLKWVLHRCLTPLAGVCGVVVYILIVRSIQTSLVGKRVGWTKLIHCTTWCLRVSTTHQHWFSKDFAIILGRSSTEYVYLQSSRHAKRYKTHLLPNFFALYFEFGVNEWSRLLVYWK